MNRKLKRLLALIAVGASTLSIALPFTTSARAAGAKHGTFKKQNGKQQNGKKQNGKKLDGPRRGRMMERMAQELKLTSSQKSRIEKIMSDSRKHGHKIWEDKSLSDAQKRQKMRENHEATRKRINAVLTPEQRKKMDAMRAKMRSQRRQNGGRSFNGRKPGASHRKI